MSCTIVPGFWVVGTTFRLFGEQRASRRTYQDTFTTQTRAGPPPQALWARSETPHPHVWPPGGAFEAWEQGFYPLLGRLIFTNSLKSRFFACSHPPIDAQGDLYPRNMSRASLKCSWGWPRNQTTNSQVKVAQPRTARYIGGKKSEMPDMA